MSAGPSRTGAGLARGKWPASGCPASAGGSDVPG